MKILIVGSIFHPEELAKLEAALTPEQREKEPPLFPPSQDNFFYVRALRQLGHEVRAFIRNVPAMFGWQAQQSARFTGTRTLATLVNALSSRAPRFQPDYRVRNRRLLRAIEDFRPDALLMIGGNRVIFPETLARIKAQYRTKILYATGDSPTIFANALERKAAPLYDLVLVNDFYHGITWLELGAQRMETLPLSACDPDFHRFIRMTKTERAAYECNIGFVGTLLPPFLYSERVHALEAVRELGLGVWSIHGVPESLKACYRGPALGDTTLRAICGSKIQINAHGNSMRYGGNIRLFEAAGCGIFQLADDRPGNRVWFTPDENIVIYQDYDHLRRLAEYYLTHESERQQIAGAAQAHVYLNHTYRHRMARMVELIAALPS